MGGSNEMQFSVCLTKTLLRNTLPDFRQSKSTLKFSATMKTWRIENVKFFLEDPFKQCFFFLLFPPMNPKIKTAHWKFISIYIYICSTEKFHSKHSQSSLCFKRFSSQRNMGVSGILVCQINI